MIDPENNNVESVIVDHIKADAETDDTGNEPIPEESAPAEEEVAVETQNEEVKSDDTI